MKRFSVIAALCASLVVGIVASCVDGDSPTGVVDGKLVRMSLVPSYSVAGFLEGSASAPANITRIRVSMVLTATDSVLQQFVQEVDPTADQCTLTLAATPPEGGAAVHF